MKRHLKMLPLMAMMLFAAQGLKAQEVIVGYSHLFTFDTRIESLSGTVTNVDDGLGIGGAILTLTGQSQSYSATTQTNGAFMFGAVPKGYYNLTIMALGFKTHNQYINVTGDQGQTIDVSLTPSASQMLRINSQLTAYAEAVSENPANVFTLSGDVNINNTLYFGGELTVDLRSHLDRKEVYGIGSIYVPNVGGQTKTISAGGIPFKFIEKNDTLYARGQSFFFELPVNVGGFPLTLAGLKLAPGTAEVRLLAIPKIPYPIDIVFQEYLELGIPTAVSNIAATLIYNIPDGENIEVSINNLKANLGLVAIQGLNLYYYSEGQVFGGSLSLRFPGTPKKPSKSDVLLDEELSVHIKNEEGELVHETSLKDFIKTMSILGGDFLEVSMELEFVSGKLNNLAVTLSGVHIPLFTTGMFITEIHGGVYNLATENWHLEATVDIETGLTIPELGKSPVKLDDFGVMIQPMDVFRGGGTFQIFESDVAGGFLEYNRPQKSISMEGQLSLGGILDGYLYAGLQYRQFSGSGLMTVKTPHIPCSLLDPGLCWIAWAGDMTLGSVHVEANNNLIQSIVSLDVGILGRASLAQRIEFGKNSFPWFNYRIGTNYNNLVKIWKGLTKDGGGGMLFQVPENTQSIIISANDTIQGAMFDFSVMSPTGKIFDNTYGGYECFEQSMICVMVIDQPMEGDWMFLTDYLGDVALYVQGLNQRPSALVNLPLKKNSTGSEISITLNDYADTLNVQVYYNTHQRSFSGTLIDEFTVINNSTLTFTWQNQDLPNGEYFIYTRVDDGKNAPVMQYAPGSFLVSNHPEVEVPKNLSTANTAQGMEIGWDPPVSSDVFATTVYYQDMSTNRISQLSAVDNQQVTLSDLIAGRGYHVWAKFMDSSGNYSQKSIQKQVVWAVSKSNHPPYFTMDPDSMFIFIAGQPSQYTLRASDADGDMLSFSILDNHLGIQISNDQLIWTPGLEQRGVHRVELVVSDGFDSQSFFQQLVVYTPQQVEPAVTFNSLRLYEMDNTFIIVKNFLAPELVQQVLLTNLSTQEQAQVTCRRVDEFNYKGLFSLSFNKSTQIAVSNGDTIHALYHYGGTDYEAWAVYDSNPQPFDLTPPGDITDLLAERLNGNRIKLSWTATGNDHDTGKAYRYDIRYAFAPIESESDYFMANLISEFPYPSMAGERDSLVIDLLGLTGIENHQQVFFSIKAEDEMQNRGGLSNSPHLECLVDAHGLTATLQDIHYIHLGWEGPAAEKSTHSGFMHYNLYRSFNEGPMLMMVSGIQAKEYNDNVKYMLDGTYQYGVRAVYDGWEGEIVTSTSIALNRFADVNILCNLYDAVNNEGIQLTMTGQDVVYAQEFTRTTNPTGLVLLANVYMSNYLVELSREGYVGVSEQITITQGEQEFYFTLYCDPMEPTALQADDITGESVSLGWTNGSTESQWDVLFGPQGFNPDLGGTLLEGITDNPYTLSGLMPSTSYDAYVRAVCGSNVGTWAGPINFITQEGVPPVVNLQDMVIADGQQVCFGALEGIIASELVVESGGHIELIAGESITLLPGTRVSSGGFLHAYISADGVFCDGLLAPAMVVEAETVTQVDFLHFVREGAFFKVYPNPTDGSFVLEVDSWEEEARLTVEVYSLLGKMVFRKELPSQQQHSLSLTGEQSGIYIIRVIKGNQVGVERLIKR